jgi:hypothetical protein
VRRTPQWRRAALGQGRRRRPLPELVALGLVAVVIVVVALLVVALVVVTFWPEATALAVVLGCALAARHLYRWKGRAAQHGQALEPEENTVRAPAWPSVGAVDPGDPEAF